MRAPLRRPHLVSSSEVHLQSEEMADVAQEQEVEADVARPSLETFERLPHVPRHQEVTRTGTAAATKRVLDVVGAVLLGMVFSPLIIAIVVLMLLGGNSVLYRHRRVGRGGQTFSCVKFRTMIPNADQVLRGLLENDPELRAEWIRDRKLRRDPRVTRLGHFLRRTSLDELPQLLNVLRGEMSLVGPRPVVREELLRYGRSVGIYLSAKPGITGLWQVTGRNNSSYRRRVALDTYYVRNQNVLLDLYILTKTTGVVLRGNGAY
jgi:exopolysaccharide production protein ExoY